MRKKWILALWVATEGKVIKQMDYLCRNSVQAHDKMEEAGTVDSCYWKIGEMFVVPAQHPYVGTLMTDGVIARH